MEYYDDLLLYLTGVDETAEDYEDQIDNKLSEEFSIDKEIFSNIMDKLLPKLTIAVSPLTGEPFVGFSEGDMWLWKKDVKQHFLNSMILWMGEGKLLSEDQKGYIREILVEGEPDPKFVLELRHGKKEVEEV